jgi:hypothetical protein
MYPLTFEADYGDGQRSRGLAALGVVIFLKALLLLPHLIILSVLGYAATLVAWIGYWVIAITGELPPFFFEFPVRILQWQARASAWLFTLRDDYPPFAWEAPDYGARFEASEGPGPRSRLFAVLGIIFIKPIAIIPHVIVLAFVQLAAVIAVWVGYVMVLFTGTLSEGIFGFAEGALRWSLRVSGWIYSLTDEYPPFRLAT